MSRAAQIDSLFYDLISKYNENHHISSIGLSLLIVGYIGISASFSFYFLLPQTTLHTWTLCICVVSSFVAISGISMLVIFPFLLAILYVFIAFLLGIYTEIIESLIFKK